MTKHNISYELPTNGYHSKGYNTCSHQGEYQCNMWNVPGEEIYQTREGVFDLLLQTLRSRLKKTRCSRDFFKRLRGAWISDQTHFRVKECEYMKHMHIF